MTSLSIGTEGFPPPAPLVIGLGANLGEPEQMFVVALRMLAKEFSLLRISPLYRSAPFGPPGQPDYLNAAVLVDAPSELSASLRVAQKIEDECGRVRSERWGPRSLDLDLLWAGNRTSNTSSLTVPHPELTRRAFALLPLLDVFPEADDPISHRSYAQILRGLEEQRCVASRRGNWWEEQPSLGP